MVTFSTVVQVHQIVASNNSKQSNQIPALIKFIWNQVGYLSNNWLLLKKNSKKEHIIRTRL